MKQKSQVPPALSDNPKTAEEPQGRSIRRKQQSRKALGFALALLGVLSVHQASAQVLLPAGSRVTADKTKPGFLWRVFSNQANQVNSGARAEDSLAGQLKAADGTFLPNLADASAAGASPNPGTKLGTADNALIEFIIPEVINLSQVADTSTGNFTPDLQMPGIPNTDGNSDGITGEIITYLDLAVGVYTMGVNSDDGFRTVAGNLKDIFQGVVLGGFEGGRGAADSIFTFSVQEAGVYPFRTVWEEGGGDANVEWFTVKADGTKVLLNDAGGVKAYRAATAVVQPPYVKSVKPGVGPRQLNQPASQVEVVLADGDSAAIDDSSIDLKIDGNSVTTKKRDGKTITLTYEPAGIQFPGENHTAELTFKAAGGFTRTEKWQFRNLKNVVLPDAVVTENFDSTAEGAQPKNWVATNFTPECNAGEDPTDQKSDTFRNWVVLTTENMPLIDDAGITDVNSNEKLNGKALTLEMLRSGKVLYAESDSRCNGPVGRADFVGDPTAEAWGQTQYIVSAPFNLAAVKNPVLSFGSGYMQNQDSYGGVEYSVDGGKIWMPVVYFLDTPDIALTADGSVDGVKTLTAPQGDTALWRANGVVKGLFYGDAVAAPIDSSIGNYIVPRINDDGKEGKRIEIFRLPAAASKADVRLRLSATGSDSWYFFIDNIAFYDIAPAVAAKTQPDAPTITLPSSLGFLDKTLTFTGSAFAGVLPSDANAQTVLQISATAGLIAATGFTNVVVLVTNTVGATAISASAERLFPGRTYYVSMQYQDKNGVKSAFSAPASFTLAALGTPIYFENFESTADFGLPTGWTVANQTDTDAAGLNPAAPKSDTYKDWLVVPLATLTAFGGGRADANVVSGKSLYAESDNRGGNQIQVLWSPEYDLRGVNNVSLAFKSSYVQNQDSIAVLEYTVDGRATWLPLTYMVNDKPSNTDIVRVAGAIDPVATLNTTAGDIAKSIDAATGKRVVAGKYADFILAGPIASLTPYISGRIDDDKLESLRYERFTLPAAGNQAKVQFRFVQAGTGSWWWGLDDLGIYGSGGGLPKLAVARQGDTIKLSWTGAGALQSATAVTGPWTNVAGATSGFSTAASNQQMFFRLMQ